MLGDNIRRHSASSMLLSQWDASNTGTITTVGGLVSSWHDTGMLGRTATQSNSALQPTHDNVNNRITFDAAGGSVGYKLDFTGIVLNNYSSFEIYYVWEPNGDGTTAQSLSYPLYSSAARFGAYVSAQRAVIYTSITGNTSPSTNINTGKMILSYIVTAITGTNNATVYKNGSSVGSVTQNFSSASVNAMGSPLRGHVHEIRIYTGSDRTAVESELNTKWSVY